MKGIWGIIPKHTLETRKYVRMHGGQCNDDNARLSQKGGERVRAGWRLTSLMAEAPLHLNRHGTTALLRRTLLPLHYWGAAAAATPLPTLTGTTVIRFNTAPHYHATAVVTMSISQTPCPCPAQCLHCSMHQFPSPGFHSPSPAFLALVPLRAVLSSLPLFSVASMRSSLTLPALCVGRAKRPAALPCRVCCQRCATTSVPLGTKQSSSDAVYHHWPHSSFSLFTPPYAFEMY